MDSPTRFNHGLSKNILFATSPPKTVTLPQKLAVGASAGILGTSIIYPIDVLKTKLQSSSQRLSWRNFGTVLSQVRSGGLYRGFSACLIGIAPEKALKLTTNDVIRDFYTKDGSTKIRLHHEILAGSLAGFVQLIITVPYESVKIKMQMGEAASAAAAIRSMGINGLYRGFTATFARDVPFCFIFFPLYAQLKSFQMQQIRDAIIAKNSLNLGLTSNQIILNSTDISLDSSIPEPFHVGLLSGIGAGAIAAALVTPADMLKTRIQRGLNGDLSFTAFARSVIQAEGASALFKGWHTRVAVIAPLYGIVALAFDTQKRMLSS